ncbi:pentapeptide repeat-containing protein [Oscillatoriales cyanobacterium LEGE 11467]|uniref:Serine/threonine-protein kinase B n=1 Tax=Zarconia navalis LEGE 11467 TaxID=1828826 RepID=A0A928W246_9CYAN|nr:serine/threonine-protein kinase [Zarconia navalis]MBE9041835.1 pentapeptide repeat-containing protein [Zarconia navalis LEGE 11467]
MSYCINPDCPNPKNPHATQECLSCGSTLLLAERYRVLKAIGKGGFGATFLAENAVLPGNPTCAIKQLRLASNDGRVLERARTLFRREAATLGKIGNHPQLPSLLDYFEIDNRFYLVQEYVQGLTLKQEVKRYGCFSEMQVKAVLDEVLQLLGYLQQNEVIHRDIKPANIIRRRLDNRLVLIDFGAVKDEVSQTGLLLDSETMTPNTSFAIGTPGFAPREQMAMKPVYASDLYALGATCLYLLIGQSPRRLDCDPGNGEILWHDRVCISPHLTQILDKMLKPLLHYRYSSAEQVLADLNREPSSEAFSSEETAAELTLANLGESNPRESDGFEETDYGSPPAAKANGFSHPQVPPTPISAATVEMPSPNPSYHDTSGETGGDSVSSSRSLSWTAKRTISNSTALQYTSATDKTSSSASGKLTPQTLKTSYKKGERDFADCDLSGFDLQHIELSQVNFYGSKLVRTNLKGANLHKADLSSASMSYAVCRGANLSNAYLSYSNLSGADLRGANLSNAYLTHANLRGANLCGANLIDAKVSQTQLAMAKTNWRTVMPNGKRSLFA